MIKNKEYADKANVEKEYFLGTGDSELERLAFQSEAWKPQTQHLWKAMAIGPASKILDLGCGPGYCTLDFSDMVGPEGKVVAIDISARFLDHLRASLRENRIENVKVQQLDIASDDISDSGFDFVFSRWLHQYVDNLDAVLQREIDCLKPGGKLGLLEVYNYRGVSFAPQSEIFNLINSQLVKFYYDSHRNVNAGANLPSLIEKHGARIESIENATPLAWTGETLWEWYRQFSFSMVPRLVEAQLITESHKTAYEAEWGKYTEMKGAFLSVPAHVAIVASKR